MLRDAKKSSFQQKHPPNSHFRYFSTSIISWVVLFLLQVFAYWWKSVQKLVVALNALKFKNLRLIKYLRVKKNILQNFRGQIFLFSYLNENFENPLGLKVIVEMNKNILWKTYISSLVKLKFSLIFASFVTGELRIPSQTCLWNLAKLRYSLEKRQQFFSILVAFRKWPM